EGQCHTQKRPIPDLACHGDTLLEPTDTLAWFILEVGNDAQISDRERQSKCIRAFAINLQRLLGNRPSPCHIAQSPVEECERIECHPPIRRWHFAGVRQCFLQPRAALLEVSAPLPE